MDQEIKRRWVEALRSGTYRQGEGGLRSKDDQFCCLGVLCDITHPELWSPPRECDDPDYPEDGFWGFEGDPNAGLMRYGLFGWEVVPEVVIGGVGAVLSRHNDKGKSFAQIADAIEAQL